MCSPPRPDRGRVVRGVWEVVPGSGNGELARLRGYGVFTAVLTPNGGRQFAEVTDTLTCWFDRRYRRSGRAGWAATMEVHVGFHRGWNGTWR